MTLPSGQISLDQVNAELDISAGTQINMGASAVRSLAEVPSGSIAMSNLQGKSNAQFITASGGSESTSGDFKIHVFNGNGTFTVNAVGNEAGSDTVDFLILAGGGSGGNVLGAGGGAGGRRISFPNPATGGQPVSATGFPVVVGGGGASGNGFFSNMRSSTNGSPSSALG